MGYMKVEVFFPEEYAHIAKVINDSEPGKELQYKSKGWKLASYGGGMLNIRDWTLEISGEDGNPKDIVIPRARVKPQWDFLSDGKGEVKSEKEARVGRILLKNRKSRQRKNNLPE